MGKSRVLSELRETMAELQSAGVVTKRDMAEFESICGIDAADMSPARIKKIREGAKVSQSVFAVLLNTSVSTVQKWEIGDKRPSGPSLKLLTLIDRKGIEVLF